MRVEVYVRNISFRYWMCPVHKSFVFILISIINWQENFYSLEYIYTQLIERYNKRRSKLHFQYDLIKLNFRLILINYFYKYLASSLYQTPSFRTNKWQKRVLWNAFILVRREEISMAILSKKKEGLSTFISSRSVENSNYYTLKALLI